MKRVFLICFLVFIAMLFAGCKLDNVDKQINEPVESKSGDVDKQISEPVESKSGNVIDKEINEPVSKSNNVTDYEVNTKEYIAYGETDKPFKVKYAQISGLSNESLESHINQTLKSSMTEWINEDCEWMEKFQLY